MGGIKIKVPTIKQIVQPLTQQAGNITKAVGEAHFAPLKSVMNLTQGKSNALAPVTGAVKRTAGVVVTATGGMGLQNAKPVQDILRNETVEKLTLGYSKNAAYFNDTANTLGSGRDPTQSQWDQSRQFLMKTGAIGAAGAFGATIAKGAGVAWGAATNVSATSYLAGTAVAGQVGSNLKRGDVAGALGAIGGVGYLNNYLPGSGDWLERVLPNGGTYAGAPAPVSGPTYNIGSDGPAYASASEPSFFSGVTSALPSVGGSSMKTLAVIAGVLGVAYLAARRL